MYWDESWWGRQPFGYAFYFIGNIIGRFVTFLTTPIDFGGNMNISLLQVAIAVAVFGLVVSIVKHIFD